MAESCIRGALAALRAPALGLVVFACAGRASERPQWRVELATDAPIPQVADRLLVEVIDDTGSLACDECQRQFGVLAAEAWNFSFGVVPPALDHRLRVRARLYRSRDAGSDGLPEGTSLIDAVGQLPSVADEDRVGLDLRLDCFGVASDVAARRTCDPATGRLGPEPVLAAPSGLRPESASSTACDGLDPEQSVCVPGGAFLLGDADRVAVIPELYAGPELLVRVSSFALDARELRVGTYRELVRAGLVQGAARHRDAQGSLADQACSYLGPDDPANDALPLNCIDAFAAEATCAALGLRLPTEAEWEFAARSRGTQVMYPWVGDEDICSHAVIAVGRAGVLNENQECRRPQTPEADLSGAQVSGTLPDVTPLGLWDMGGNVAEWTADDFAPYTGECWAGLLSDPRCQMRSMDGLPPLRSIRGGGWAMEPLQSETTRRKRGGPERSSPEVGFRCARAL